MRRLARPLPAWNDDRDVPYSGRGALEQAMAIGALLELAFLELVGETSLPLWMVCVFGWLPWGIFVPYNLAFSLWFFVRLPLWRGRVRRAAYSVLFLLLW